VQPYPLVAKKGLDLRRHLFSFCSISDAPPNAEIELDDTPEAMAARAAERRWAVAAMIRMGVRLTERLCAEVDAAAEGVKDAEASKADAGVASRLGGRDPALAYSRLFRAVRLGAALGQRLDQPAPGAEGESWRADAAATDDDAARRRAGVRGHILGATIQDVVESLIETEVEGDLGGERATGLLEALSERLEDNETLEDIGGRSIGESIALICRDLGLTPDWSLWAYEDWAKTEAQEQTLGSPFGRPRRPARAERQTGDHKEPSPQEPALGRAAQRRDPMGGGALCEGSHLEPPDPFHPPDPPGLSAHGP
jgi:hypothetical protein